MSAVLITKNEIEMCGNMVQVNFECNHFHDPFCRVEMLENYEMYQMQIKRGCVVILFWESRHRKFNLVAESRI